AGALRPTSGAVLLHDAPLRHATPDRLARKGIGRTFQHSNVFGEFSVFENCRLAAQSRTPRPWALHERATRCSVSTAIAQRALAETGLDARDRKSTRLN